MPGGLTRLHDRYLIAGHSHRPRLPENGELYLNAGSCVSGCITAIELEQMQMTLVKWKVATRPDMTMYVVREACRTGCHFVGKTRFFKKSFDGTAIYDNIYIVILNR